MNRNPTDRQASLTSGPDSVYSFELHSGTVVSSLAPSGARIPSGGVAASGSSRPTGQRSCSELWRLVLTDKLTGLCNQHGFIALAEQQWRVSRRTDREMVFVGVELQGLEEIRDSFGRGEDSFALIAAGRILARTFRRSDIVSRWSGEEFRMLAVDGQGLEEEMLSARIQSQLRRAAPPVGGYPWTFKGRLARIQTRAFCTFAEVLARLAQDLAGCTSTWSAPTAPRADLDSSEHRRIDGA